jgi:hypothetical protein
MKNKLLILFLLSFLVAAVPPVPVNYTMAQTPPIGDQCRMPNTTFLPGEKITYKVYYNLNFVWIPAGEVVFTVGDMGSEYHLKATGRTFKSYDWFFKVRDQYESIVDKETLLPSVSVRDVKEGGYTLYDKVEFDQKNKTAYGIRGRSQEKIKERNHFEIDGCMHDILSILYFARNIDYDAMDKGDKLPVSIFLDKEVYPLKVDFKGREANKKIKGLGHFNTIKFSPEVIVGNYFNEGTEMFVWVTDDQNRIPLLIESPVSVGSIKVVLNDYEGLKYQMKAEVE